MTMTIKAGTGTRRLDVPSGTPLLGDPGFACAATGVHDPLLVTAVHVRSGVHGSLFISLDLYGLDPYQHQRMRDAIAAATSVRRDRIFMGCSRTLAGPVSVWSYAWKDDRGVPGPDSVFLESVAQATVAAAAEACATTRPVTLGLVAHPRDPAGGTLALRQEDDALAALLTVNPEPCPSSSPGNTLVSAGLPFFFRERLAERQNREIPVVFLESPSGGREREWPAGPDPFSLARQTGRSLADATLAALETADWHAMDSQSEFSFHQQTATLSFRVFPDDLELRLARHG